MYEFIPGLWQTPGEHRFGSMRSHAYLVESGGNLDLIYVPETPEVLAAISRMGRVQHMYLSHNHEITQGMFAAHVTLRTRLAGHARMGAYFGDESGLDEALDFEGVKSLPNGIEAIYSPGHTDNSLCYHTRACAKLAPIYP